MVTLYNSAKVKRARSKFGNYSYSHSYNYNYGYGYGYGYGDVDHEMNKKLIPSNPLYEFFYGSMKRKQSDVAQFKKKKQKF